MNAEKEKDLYLDADEEPEYGRKGGFSTHPYRDDGGNRITEVREIEEDGNLFVSRRIVHDQKGRVVTPETELEPDIPDDII